MPFNLIQLSVMQPSVMQLSVIQLSQSFKKMASEFVDRNVILTCFWCTRINHFSDDFLN